MSDGIRKIRELRDAVMYGPAMPHPSLAWFSRPAPVEPPLVPSDAARGFGVQAREWALTQTGSIAHPDLYFFTS